MNKIVEILLYTLKSRTGPEFHKIMNEVSVPLHRNNNIDVVSFGNSLHDPDGYYLVRAYDSLDHLNSSQQVFYESDAWRNGPRTNIVERISTSLKSVLELNHEAVEALRRSAS